MDLTQQVNELTVLVQNLLDTINNAIQTGFADEDVITDIREDNNALLKGLETFCEDFPDSVQDVTQMRDGCLRLCSSYTRNAANRQQPILHGYSMIIGGFSKWTSRMRYSIPPNPNSETV